MAKRTLFNYFDRVKVPRLQEDASGVPFVEAQGSGAGGLPVADVLSPTNDGEGLAGPGPLARSTGGRETNGSSSLIHGSSGGSAGAEDFGASIGGEDLDWVETYSDGRGEVSEASSFIQSIREGVAGTEVPIPSSVGGLAGMAQSSCGGETIGAVQGSGGELAGASSLAQSDGDGLTRAETLTRSSSGKPEASSSGDGDVSKATEVSKTKRKRKAPGNCRSGKKTATGNASATRNDGASGQADELDDNDEVRLQKFRTEWITGELSCFEAHRHDEYLAWCTVCLDKLSVARGGKSNLSSHLNTHRHTDNAKKICSRDSKIDAYVQEDQGSLMVMEAELKICSWAVENNVSFAAVDSLIGVLKSLDPESKLFNSVKLGRTKATSVVTGVIAEQQHCELVKRMQTERFTLFVDESTDNTSSKTLAMVVRVFNDGGCDEPDEFEANDVFYAAVEPKLCDHQSLYDAIIEQFKKDGIDHKKTLRGFGSDGANVLMGKENSVMTLLKKDCPDMQVVKCSCHSLALCASYACKAIPDYCENLLRDIYSYINNSPKRAMEYRLIQEIVELKPVRMLHPSATRWLSLEQVVKRVLERFRELCLFFKFQADVDKNPTAIRILDHLQDKMTKPLLLFLNYILPMINRLNRLFQSEDPQITLIHEEITNLETTILSNICKDDFIASLPDFNVDVPADKHLKNTVYVGIEAEAASAELDSERLRTFHDICKRFYKELHKQLRKRFDLNDPVLKAVSKLNPSSLKDLNSICPLVTALPGLHQGDLQEIENEFRVIKMKLARKEISTEYDSVQKWWKSVLSLKRADGQLAFPLMRVFVGRVFLIPHSSACVERIFSQYNNNKTKLRNRLVTETIQAILRAKNFVKNQGGSSKIKLTDEIKRRFTRNMYKHHNRSANQSS